MTAEELEGHTLAYLDTCASIHRYHEYKSPLPISRRTVARLRKKLFAAILGGEVGEEYADAAQRVLSASAKALERKEVMAAGRAVIEAEKSQEAALVSLGFKFHPAFGDFIKVIGRRREHWLCLFLDENGQAAATLNHNRRVLICGGELGRWRLRNMENELVNVLKDAEKRVANLPLQGRK